MKGQDEILTSFDQMAVGEDRVSQNFASANVSIFAMGSTIDPLNDLQTNGDTLIPIC
jgi:hypothetical protein